MIQIKNLNHYYGRFRSLQQINLTITQGSIAGFIGPNGAGKSTLLKILSGFLVPTSGVVLLDGISLSGEPVLARKKIGYMPETPYLYREMRVEEYLDFVAHLKGVFPVSSKEEWKQERDGLIERCGLSLVRHKLIGRLSRGNRQRAALAQALVGHPTILLLDEPTSALDPGQVIEIRNFIRELKGTATILMSSHVLSEIAQVCDDIVFIRDGSIQYHSASRQIDLNKNFKKGGELLIRFSSMTEAWIQELSSLPGGSLQKGHGGYGIERDCLFRISDEEVFFPCLFQWVTENRIPLREIVSQENRLESLFEKS